MNMEDILEALGIQDLSEDEQQTMLLDLQSLLFKGSVVRMLEQMEEQQKDAFNEYLSGNPSEEDMMAYLEKNVPDAEGAVRDTLTELKNDILASTKQ
jgi:Protein of unknown function (DUF5663)